MQRIQFIALIIVVAIVFFMIASIPRCAAETAITFGGWSKHIDDYGYRNHHEMFAVSTDKYAIGRFTNSYNRPTTFAVYRWTEQYGDFEGAINVGAMYGYRSCIGDEGDRSVLCPALVPQITYTKYKVQPTVLVLGNAVTMAITYQW